MLLLAKGSVEKVISSRELENDVVEVLKKLGNKQRVLVIPPDFTRFHSRAGEITKIIYNHYGDKLKAILPAIGTHFPMTKEEIEIMFGDIPHELFVKHDWRNDVVTLGRVPSKVVNRYSEGKVDFDWPAQVNKLLVEGNFDLILSVGQVVPHEVIGMANYNKNIFVGTGGREGINKSHFLGAAYGLEKIMGRADTPVRQVLNYASQHFASDLPIAYIQTVIGKDEANKLQICGLYAGDDEECFNLAASLSLQANFQLMDKPLGKVVVYLEESEFKSTWLGNKSIYRTRMAIDDGGELIVLAPGIREFGEDREIDFLIRKYGYRTTEDIMRFISENEDLANDLAAAAHLIHGSSEERFTVTYCPGHLSKEEIESVNYQYADLQKMLSLYNPDELKDGYNQMPDGEEIFYISNPALGLWAYKERFF